MLFPSSARAANPTTISFQGKMVNANGTNVTNGTYSVIFRLYNTASPTTSTACASDGTCLWEETQSSVTVTNGVFQVELGSVCLFFTTNACNKSTIIDFNSSNALYLTLKFNGDAAGFMSPTIHFTSVPYAFNSDKLGGVASTGYVQIGPSGVQTDGTNNATIFINKSTGTGNILELQKSGTDMFTIANNGATTLASGSFTVSNSSASGINVTGTNPQLQVGSGTFGFAGGAGAYSNIASTNDSIFKATGGNLILSAQNATGNIYLTTGATDTAKLTILNNGKLTSTSTLTTTSNENGATYNVTSTPSSASVATAFGSNLSLSSSSTNMTGDMIGTYSLTTYSAAAVGGKLFGGSFSASLTGGGTSTSQNTGIAAYGGNSSSSGTVANAMGGFFQVQSSGTSSVITQGSGLYISNAAKSSGTITRSAGLVVETQTKGATNSNVNVLIKDETGFGTPVVIPSGTQNYSIYNSSTYANYFAGNLGLASTGAANLLSLNTLAVADSTAQIAVATGGTGNKGLLIQAVASQSADLLQFQDNGGLVLSGITSSGDINLGRAGASGRTGTINFLNSANAFVAGIQAGTTAASYTLKLPTAAPSTSQCLQSDSVTATQLTFASCAGGGGGDNITVNASAATDANFIDTTATGTVAGTTWTLNTAPAPDTIALSISAATSSLAGTVTNTTQSFGGSKTFVGPTQTFQNATDSTNSFQVLNAAGSGILTVNGTNTLFGPSFSGVAVSNSDVITTVVASSAGHTPGEGATAVIIGTDGMPGIAYYDGSTTDDLMYVHCTTSTCSSADAPVTIDSGTIGDQSVNNFARISLQIGSDGFPIIAYRDTTTQSLKVAHCTTITCSSSGLTTVDAVNNMGVYASMVIPSDGLPVIFSEEAGNGKLKVIKCSNTACTSNAGTSTYLDSTGATAYLKATIGQDGLPMVAYKDAPGSVYIRIAKCSTVACSANAVGSPYTTPAYTGDNNDLAVAVPADGLPVIFFRNVSGNAAFVKCANTTCTTTNTYTDTVTSGAANISSITIGSDGLPIAVSNTFSQGVVFKCTTMTCSSWTRTIIDSGVNGGNTASITVGRDGLPLISYYNGTNTNLRTLRCGDLACSGGTSYASNSGVDIGTPNTSIRTIYLDSINSSVAGSNFQLNADGSFRTAGFSVSTNGSFTALSGTPSTTAFQVQNTSGTAVFAVDTLNTLVKVNGGIVGSVSTSDLVKTSTSTGTFNDFSYSGSATLTNVSALNNAVAINDGSVPSSGAGTWNNTSQPTTSVAVGAGAFTILRDDGKYIIVHGGGATTGSIWDGSTAGAMSASPTAPSTAAVGAGAIGLKRPDGRYLVINGGGSLGTTSLFDPYGITATAGGPAVCGGGATTTGTNAFLRDDGKYVILCGGLTAWGTYDPTANTYAAGTAVGTAFGAGAFAIHRDDGTFLVFAGGNVTTHWLYNPYASATGTMTANPIVSNAPTINTGAFAIRRQDGKFLVMGGAINTSSIYDPTPTSSNSGAGSMTSQSGAGFGPTAALGDGAQAVWREDGKYTLLTGAATTTNIIDPSLSTSSQFTASTSLPTTIGAGAHMFLRPNGQYQLINGNATTATQNYDIGYVMGGQGSGVTLASYETECMVSSNLNTSSSLYWNNNAEGNFTVQVKTGASGSCSGSYKTIANSGDLIRPGSSDNAVQVKVFFQRNLPYFADQEWGMRRGLGQVRYRRVDQSPVLYDVSVDNSAMLRKTQFDLGVGGSSSATDPSGPLTVNLTNNSDKNLSLTLPAGIGWGTTQSSANPAVYNGSFTTAPAALTSAPAASSSNVVMKRPDGKFMIITSNAAANAMLYDPIAQTMTAQSGAGNIPTAVIGAGALAFKRPDGKFLLVTGNASTTTNIFDPNGASGSVFTAGPATTAAVGHGSLVIPLPTGRILIIHGNASATTSIYDPVQNVMYAGPTTSANVGVGSLVIPRPDGTFVVALGQGVNTPATCPGALVSVTNFFNPYTMQFTATLSPTMTLGPGAFAFQRSDGLWVVATGGATITTCAATTATIIYNPYTNKVATGPVLSSAAQMGAHAIPRPDGNWLVISGSATSATTSSIYVEKAGAYTAEAGGPVGQFIAGPALTSGAGAGSLSFQRPDGKFVTLCGNATTTVLNYDGGWVSTGIYKSEEVSVPNLGTSSTLVWRSNSTQQNISAEVRTASSQLGIQTATWREIGTSGGLINPNTGDTWIQINFNFKRTFPSYSGIETDTWYNGGATGMFYPLRPVAIPTLNSYAVTNDADLLNLKADGMSVFRVNSSGDVYTTNGGTINTGGADLAERYTSSEKLVPGQLVSVDPTDDHNVKSTSYTYQHDLLGVVSTAPGFVAGSYTEGSYPIALVGRVPVLVTTENGMIHAGDRITSSTLAGYGMRATWAGRVVGVALTSLDESSLVDCPDTILDHTARKCGTVNVFVNLADYQGDDITVIMHDRPDLLAASSGLSIDGDNTSTAIDLPGTTSDEQSSVLADAPGNSSQVLDFLKRLRDSTTAATGSSVTANQINAINTVIAPTIITDTLIAKNIKADSIEGLQVITGSLATLTSKVGKLTSGGNTSIASGGLAIDSATVKLDLSVLGALQAKGGLTVDGPAEFRDNTLFGRMATFLGDAIFRGNTSFEKAPTFSADTAGYAIIHKGASKLDIKFVNSYQNPPIINAAVTLNKSPAPSNPTTEQQAAYEANEKARLDSALNQNYQYVIYDRSTTGFSLVLNKPATDDLLIAWTAIGVNNPGTSESLPTPTPNP